MSATSSKKNTPKFNKFQDILSEIPAAIIDSISSHVKDQTDLQDLVTILKKVH